MGILGRWRNQQPEDKDPGGNDPEVIETLSDPNPNTGERYAGANSRADSRADSEEEFQDELDEADLEEDEAEPGALHDEEDDTTPARSPLTWAASQRSEPEDSVSSDNSEDESEDTAEEYSMEELEAEFAEELAAQRAADELEAANQANTPSYYGEDDEADPIVAQEEPSKIPEDSVPEAEISDEEIAAVFAAQLAAAEQRPDYASANRSADIASAPAPKLGPLASFKALRKSVKASVDRRVGSRTLTLSVEGETIRVLLFRGSQIISWKSIPIQTASPEPMPDSEPGLDPAMASVMASEMASVTESGTGSEFDSARNQELNPEPDLNAAERLQPQAELPLAVRLQNLFEELGLGRNQVWKLLDKVGIRKSRLAMDLSLYTTLLRHLELPKVRQKYLHPVVESEVLENIPFIKEEVDIAWRNLSHPQGESVFAIALPKDRLNSQVQLVKDAGGVPSAAYSKAIALALVAGYSDVVIVHLEPHQAAVVLVQDSVPQVVHQLEFPPDEGDSRQHTDALALVIDQIAEYNEVLDLQNGNVLVPVVLTGDTSETNPIAGLLPQTLARDVLFIEPGLDCPEQFPSSEYATNLGLFLLDQACTARPSRKDGKSQMPYINLLPQRHRPRSVPVLQTAVFVTMLLLAIHPFNFPARVDAKVVESEIISSQLARLQSQNQQRVILLSNERSTESQLGNVNSEITILENQLDNLQIDLDLLLARMQTLTNTALPPTVEVFTIAPQGTSFAIQGTANEYSQILDYSNNIRNSGLFAEAKILRLDNGTDQGPSRAPSALEIAVLGLSGGGDDAAVRDVAAGFVSFQIEASIPSDEVSPGEAGPRD